PPDCLKDSPLKKATALGDFAHCGERQGASPLDPTTFLKKGRSKTFVLAFGFKRVVFQQTQLPYQNTAALFIAIIRLRLNNQLFLKEITLLANNGILWYNGFNEEIRNFLLFIQCTVVSERGKLWVHSSARILQNSENAAA
ncbi:MAG: hypothetical protein IJY06_04145, partial [Oscillospiraceae bacterium]|nr:hypothetical protein [Oscillospiraceae bacterium]